MNPLVNIFGEDIRKYVYYAYGFIGLGLGGIPVYTGATGATAPSWTLGALAVYAFVAGPLFGATAASNASVTPPKES